MGELFSNSKGDGVFREENTMLPMLTTVPMKRIADT